MELANVRIFGGLADGRLADMGAERAKIAAEPDLIVEADLLIAEKDHLVLDEGLVQLLDLIVRQRLGQIDIADFRADMRRNRLDRDGFIVHEYAPSLRCGSECRRLIRFSECRHGR